MRKQSLGELRVLPGGATRVVTPVYCRVERVIAFPSRGASVALWLGAEERPHPPCRGGRT